MKEISIIVPIYYGEKYIPNIIYQIEAGRMHLENDDYMEIIFVNDSPETPLFTERKGKNISVSIINMEKHLGIHGARIRGLKEACGEYVLFLDQDDIIRPKYFYSQLQNIGENDAVVCQALHEGKDFYLDDESFEMMITRRFLLEKWNPIVSPGQVLLRKKAIPDEWVNNVIQHNGADDLFLWICMAAKECSFSLNYELLYEHITQKSNASNNFVAMRESEQEVMQIIQKKKILGDGDFEILLAAFFDKNLDSIYKLESAETKLALIEKWLELKEKNIKYSMYLDELGIKTIAIYGCGLLGKFLYDEIKQDINVKYFIDRNAEHIEEEIPVYSLHEGILGVDAIVISLIQGYETINFGLEKKFEGRLLVLKDWLMGQ